MDTAIVQMLKSGKKDLTWFEFNLDKLVLEYPNKFIAFSNNKVIDSDMDLDKLIARLKDNGVPFSNLLIRFVSNVKAIL